MNPVAPVTIAVIEKAQPKDDWAARAAGARAEHEHGAWSRFERGPEREQEQGSFCPCAQAPTQAPARARNGSCSVLMLSPSPVPALSRPSGPDSASQARPKRHITR